MTFTTKLKYFFFNIFDMVSFLIFVWWIVLFIRFFVANPYTVVGASMFPTFDDNDFIIVDKLTSRFSDLSRGDVIVFVPPGKTIPYIKRIIWLPWETVKITRRGVVVCSTQDGIQQCTTMEENYLTWSALSTEARCGLSEFVISTGWFFVMGDNRWFSTDSRCCFGLSCYDGSSYEVPFANIIGKVYVRFFPNFSTF